MTARRALGLVPFAAAAALVGCSLLHDGRIDVVQCSVEGAYGAPACPEGKTCVAGVCTGSGVPPGYACKRDADCQLGAYCGAAPPDVGASLDPEASAVCVLPCCASTDCGDPALGLVCAAPPKGEGRICARAAALVGRSRPGGARAGSACSGGGECRSGVCGTAGTCTDFCCDDSYCVAPDAVCALRAHELGPGLGWVCGPKSAPSDTLPCHFDGDCRSGKCLSVALDVGVCATPCCSSAECGSVLVGNVPQALACAAVEGSFARACSVLVGAQATLAVGEPCDSAGQCRSGSCSDDGMCTDACCVDSDCGDATRFGCEEVPDGPAWSLQCVMK